MEDYIRLAALQGRHPQDFAVFRRHLSLQAFSLLRQQNEIAHLEQILGTYVTAARGATEAASVLSGLALHRSQDRSPDEAEQLRLWDELEAKLKLYGKACCRPDTCIARVQMSIHSSISFFESMQLPLHLLIGRARRESSPFRCPMPALFH